MSPEDSTALAFLVVGVIVTLALLTTMVKHWLNFQQRKLEILAGQTAERAAQYAADNTAHHGAVEQRLRVLESIVTDRGYDVATRIDALHDVRRPDA